VYKFVTLGVISYLPRQTEIHRGSDVAGGYDDFGSSQIEALSM
jgi:hypothetical protein